MDAAKYDVFISFKNTDSNGNKTKDSIIAKKLYHYLTGKGLKVFLSELELEFLGKARYSKVIDDALDSSKFLIAVGCSKNNLESEWVRHEWEGFLSEIRSNIKPDGEVFVFYQDMKINDLPRSLREQQAFNAIDNLSYEKLFNFINNNMRRDAPKKIIIEQNIESQNKDEIDKDIETPLVNGIHFDYDEHFLSSSQKEKENILRHIEDELNLTEGSIAYNFFKDLLNDTHSATISMIEVNIARKYFARVSVDEYEAVLNKNNPMELIKEEYFEKLFSALEHPDLGLVILYSLCNCGYSDGLSVSDFKNLTFAQKNIIDTMLRIFVNQEIIKQIKPVYEAPYIMTHDYLINFLESYCSRKLSEQIITNIRFYCLEKNKRREKAGKNKDDSPISLYYKNTIDKRTSSKVILSCIGLLCFVIFCVCILQEIKGYSIRLLSNIEYDLNQNILALTILAIGSAIYYIYHYLYYFAKIFFSKKGCVEFWICILLIIYGMTSVNLAIMINELWVSWLAIEWMLIGIMHFVLSKKTLLNENVRNRIAGESRLYIIVAFVFIGLNIFVLKFEAKMMMMYLGLPIFIIFVILTNRQHINTDFMLAKIGSFVNLSTREENK
jgi:hypothetical protein